MTMQLEIYAKRYLPQPIVDVLRVVKYRMDLATFSSRVVSHRYGRHCLHMNINDRVAGEWYDKDWELPPEIEFLSHGQIPRSGRVFDLGAYQCLNAMLLAREVVPEGSVVAVEANRHNVEIARSNLELNGVDNIDVVHGLASSSIGKAHADLSFNSRAKQGIEALVSEAVDALSIDQLSQLKGPPDLVYMDIEGFEIEALKGATQTLQRWCHWFVELHGDAMLARYGARNSDILKFFGIQDFARFVFQATENKFRQVTESEPLPAERCFVIFAPRSARLINHTLGERAQRQ
jgi:FkbM family methyltransferase